MLSFIIIRMCLPLVLAFTVLLRLHLISYRVLAKYSSIAESSCSFRPSMKAKAIAVEALPAALSFTGTTI
jgi:hypothetical protein